MLLDECFWYFDSYIAWVLRVQLHLDHQVPKTSLHLWLWKTLDSALLVWLNRIFVDLCSIDAHVDWNSLAMYTPRMKVRGIQHYYAIQIERITRINCNWTFTSFWWILIQSSFVDGTLTRCSTSFSSINWPITYKSISSVGISHRTYKFRIDDSVIFQ